MGATPTNVRTLLMRCIHRVETCCRTERALAAFTGLWSTCWFLQWSWFVRSSWRLDRSITRNGMPVLVRCLLWAYQAPLRYWLDSMLRFAAPY